MNIKIQCSCETKFSFDVEPIDGRMPVSIYCPKCGADGTESANQVIAQILGVQSEVAAVPPVQKSRIRLQVAHQPAAATPSGESATGEAAVEGEKCHRHPRA